MADETTPDALPFPEPDDDNDVPGFMQALAERIQVIIAGLRAAFVPNTREVNTSAGSALTGGGALDEDLELAVDFATDGVSSSTKAVRANDLRLSNARPPTAHSHGGIVDVVQPSADLALDPAVNSFYTDVPGLTKTFTVPDAVNDYAVHVDLDVTVRGNVAGDQPTCAVRLVVDGGPVLVEAYTRIPIAGTARIPVHKSWVVSDLSAANHTIKVQVAASGGAMAGASAATVFKADSQMVIERSA